MRKINQYTLLLVILAIFTGCSDDDSGQAIALGIVEANYVGTTSPMTLNLKDNETLQLTPFIMPTTATTKEVGYENLAPDVYDITSGGLITPKVIDGEGFLRVYTTDGSNISVKYLVVIADHVIRPTAITVSLPTDNITLALDPAGDSYNLGAIVSVTPTNAANRAVVYESANPLVAAVTAEGVVTPVSVGETTIIVTPADNKNNLRAVVPVIVRAEVQKVEQINISAEAQILEMTSDETYTLSRAVTVLPSDAYNKNVVYSSSNLLTASVDASGVITALAMGTATITVTAQDGSNKTATCTVNVTKGYYERSSWTVTTSTATSYGNVTDGSTGRPEHMFDNEGNTFLSLVKPGKSYSPIPSQSSTFIPSFTIDMQTQLTFNHIKWRHRSTNTYNYLRVFAVNLEGSNDGTSFTTISTMLWIPNSGGYVGSVGLADATNHLIEIPQSTYQHIKVSLVMWSDIYNGQHADYPGAGSTSGSTMQIAEFSVGMQ